VRGRITSEVVFHNYFRLLRYEVWCIIDSLQKITLSNSMHIWFQTFAVFSMLYVFFWVIPRRLNFICWRRHIKFRRRGITQKKTYSVHITHLCISRYCGLLVEWFRIFILIYPCLKPFVKWLSCSVFSFMCVMRASGLR
jgi:hypothetical protein